MHALPETFQATQGSGALLERLGMSYACAFVTTLFKK